VDSVVCDPPYGLSFMGKKWDYDVPTVELWKEAIRVLKPGGHLLSFAGSRTYHRMAVNIEDAGFEIRDQIMWVYGSGFPKSHNIGKAVHKLQGNEMEVTGERRQRANSEESQIKMNASVSDIEIITKGTSPYEGWGTALKPAHEPICMARKPLSESTIAQNVLKWGTGGINIDGCRVGTEGGGTHCGNRDDKGKCLGHNDINDKYGETIHADEVATQGRFPANFIHDGSDEVVGLFPDTKSGMKTGKHNGFGRNGIYSPSGAVETKTWGDSGSASRFFYCAKASKKDRNEGLEGFEEKQTIFADGTNFHKNGDGTPRNKEATIKNHHPCIKPTSLMQYLVRLVTPKGGTVLDPFAGSFSTGKACVLEGFDFIGIELDKEYCAIGEARMAKAKRFFTV